MKDGAGALLRQSVAKPAGGEPERCRSVAPGPTRRVGVVGNVDIVKFRGWLIEDMVAQGHTVFACAPELSLPDRDRLAKAGASYQRIGLERTGINPLRDLAHVARLAALFRRLKVEVVIAHTTKAMIVGCLAARLAGVPKIFAIVEGLGHAFTDGPERKRRLIRAVLAPAMKAALAVCDGVFVLNSDDRAYLIGLGILSPKQTVVQIAGTGLDLHPGGRDVQRSSGGAASLRLWSGRRSCKRRGQSGGCSSCAAVLRSADTGEQPL